MAGRSKHADWIRSLPCHCGDQTSTEAAHVRYSEYRSGKINPGTGKKPADIWLVPLCSYHHRMQHAMGERHFWYEFKINPITYAVLLHQYSGDINKLPEILEKARIKPPDPNTYHRPTYYRERFFGKGVISA